MAREAAEGYADNMTLFVRNRRDIRPMRTAGRIGLEWRAP